MSEHQQLEYKQVWKDDWLKTICAFANAQGGRLIIGCDDNGNVLGLKNMPKLLEDIPNKVRDVLGVMVDVNCRSDGQSLEIRVDPYPNPVSYKGEYFYRSGSTAQALKGVALERFFMKKRGLHWDGIPVPGVPFEDLSEKTLHEFRVRAAESKRMPSSDLAAEDKILVDKLKLTKDGYLKNSAVLLFHPDPEKFVTGAFIKVGFFRNNTDLRFQDEIHGNLFAQTVRTMDLLLTKYTEATISYRGVQRVERYPVPEEALREALLNAVVHRDYSVAAPVQIRVYADKLSIWNPGQLPIDWNVFELLNKHASYPFNPDIANAFFRAGMIEAWGRGIEKIFESCAAAKVPLPEIRSDQTGVRIEFSFSAQADDIGSRAGAPENAPENAPGIEAASLLQTELIEYLQKKPRISYDQLAELTGKDRRTVSRNIAKLKEAGLVKRIGPAKGGHWEVLE